MKKLIDYVTIVRSKNAGPLFLTFDLIFKNKEAFQEIVQKNIIQKSIIAKLYDCEDEDVDIIFYDVVEAIKITIPRKVVSGCLADTDIYGCQQHVALGDIEVYD